MGKIPCRKCKKCGIYHTLAIDICDECGTELINIPAVLMDEQDIPLELQGDFDKHVLVYVQKCSACGTLNFTTDKNKPVRICYNCHKSRVAAVEPIEFVSEDEIIPGSDIGQNDTGNKESTGTQQIHIAGQNPTTLIENDEDDEEDLDSQAMFWLKLKSGIDKTVSQNHGSTSNVTPKRDTTVLAHDYEPAISNNTDSPYDDSDDDDDADAGDWSGVFGTTVKPTPSTPPIKKAITLTAIRYGRLSFTIEVGQDTYMLGRSANQGDFLSQDGRVGNEHCFLFYRNGAWYVKDNHSSNGTAVNSRDIGLNGECMLRDGDELKLGHHSDSAAFRVTIK